jgi:hypothetical protein
MGDKLATRADLEGLTAATAAITALTAQIAMLSNYLKNNNINANNSNVNNKFRRRQISMGTPSSSTRFTNTIPVSRKFEDFEKNVSKSKGFVNCVNLEIPSTTQKGSCVKNTTSSCEALLRGQAKIIMQMPPKKETLEILTPTSQIRNLYGIATSIVQQQSISHVANVDHDSCEFRKCEITKSFDFSEKFQASEECNSKVSYEEITQGTGVGGCSKVDDDASIWAMQVNSSNYDEDDIERGIVDEIKQTRNNLVMKVKPVLSFYCMSQYQADEALYQDENSGSSSFEVEEKVKTSKTLMYGPSMWAPDSSTQTFVFDPGIRVREFPTKASLYYKRTRGRVLHKKRSLMQEQFNAMVTDMILFYYLFF